jgi:hypothetical protein
MWVNSFKLLLYILDHNRHVFDIQDILWSHQYSHWTVASN